MKAKMGQIQNNFVQRGDRRTAAVNAPNLAFRLRENSHNVLIHFASGGYRG